MVAGLGDVNGDAVGKEASKAVVVAYDALTLAGTQGYFNHLKLDRMLELAEVQHPCTAPRLCIRIRICTRICIHLPNHHPPTHPPTYPPTHPPTPVS